MYNNKILTELPKWTSGFNIGKVKWKEIIGMDLQIEFNNNNYIFHINDFKNRQIYFYIGNDK